VSKNALHQKFRTGKETILKLPLTVGEEWSCDYTTIGNPVLRVVFFSTALSTEKVTVPAGTFEAIRVEIAGSISGPAGGDEGGMGIVLTDTCWYAPNVGVVKCTNHTGDEYVLKSFTPGKD
jgi:hypothetical protein